MAPLSPTTVDGLRQTVALRAEGLLTSPEAAARRRELLESHTQRRILPATAPAAAPSARRSKSLGSAHQSLAERARLAAAEIAGAARLATRTPGGKPDAHRNRDRSGSVAAAEGRARRQRRKTAPGRIESSGEGASGTAGSTLDADAAQPRVLVRLNFSGPPLAKP